MEREVRYCTSEDGVCIGYTVAGSGSPVVFALPNPTGIEVDHEVPEVDAFFRSLLPGRMVVRYDMRGTGASDRTVPGVSPSAQALDLAAVVDHLALERFAIFAGPASPAHAAVLYAVAHPDRVERLMLWAIVPVLEPDEGHSAEAERTLIRENWRGATRIMGDAMAPRGSVELKKRITWIARETLTPEMFLLHSQVRSDIRTSLPLVSVPTLVLNCRDDRRHPLEASRRVATQIPGSRLLTIEGDTAYFFVYHQQLVSLIDGFLGGEGLSGTRADQKAVLAQPFRTVLFTDLVGHTEMMSRLGDEKGREVLREHERITREMLAAHGGTEVKTMGDGFMASFGSVTKAVECAVALQRAFSAQNQEPRTENLAVRVGLNAGEPIEEDGDLFGATVILASRIAAKAEGGEILVADTVRGLCSGKGFTFSDRGEFVAKGFEEPVRVYEVEW